ncbi:hypothetical protein D641_0103575 [Brachybacterium muris UCD-AY4]|uniref:Uncharacterized protein n=1 Tax=Brachybacterium muris UCD-AY4 TaxID=1249481 RepID=A0A022KZ85_9MICO|nr:hypothetical protein D641_0103575 [Brachybacterium muris UCD-AY4]
MGPAPLPVLIAQQVLAHQCCQVIDIATHADPQGAAGEHARPGQMQVHGPVPGQHLRQMIEGVLHGSARELRCEGEGEVPLIRVAPVQCPASTVAHGIEGRVEMLDSVGRGADRAEHAHRHILAPQNRSGCGVGSIHHAEALP